MIQQLGVGDALSFPGSELALFALSSVVYVYGGWPFLTGFTSELREGMPGMMTQIALAISVAYVYSATVTFDIPGMSFYWELVTLIVIMLLGHWLEMRSVMGASRALEELVRLLPDTASRIDSAGSVHEVAISALRLGDHVLIRLGSKVPVDGTILAGKSSFNQVKPTGDLPTPFQGTGRWRHRWRDQRRERGHHRSHGNR
jgi:Cu2+-exporting ATPase